MFKRQMIREGAMMRPSAPGDGTPSNYSITAVTDDANTVLTVSAILGGLIIRSGLTALRTDTLPTAVALIAALEGINIGDTFSCKYANQAAQNATILTGAGITLTGIPNPVNATSVELVFTMTAAATLDCVVF